MKHTTMLLCVALAVMSSGAQLSAQAPGDLAAINRLLDQYAATEAAGDMAAQARLMTEDRVWVGGPGRRTDQAANMRMQQAVIDEQKKFAPGTKVFVEARDRLIRFYGGGSVAVASFYWNVGAIPAGDLPMEKARAFENQPPVAIATAVLTKERGDWKIAHTHFSNVETRGF